jgi:hypothetical protein
MNCVQGKGWRLPVFEAGKHFVAFDGAALLLLELWRRQAARESGGGGAGGRER